MLAIAFALCLGIVMGSALAVRHRRGRRSTGLSPAIDPRPAGVRHLAKTVSDLSDLGLHLPAARHTEVGRRSRLGALLDSRN